MSAMVETPPVLKQNNDNQPSQEQLDDLLDLSKHKLSIEPTKKSTP